MNIPQNVVSAQASTENVWNLTDDPKRGHKPQTIVLFGRAVAPGSAVAVDREELEAAKKRVADLGSMIHVGVQPPQDYLVAKGRVRVKMPRNASRAHGPIAQDMSYEEMERLTAPDDDYGYDMDLVDDE